MSKSSQKNRNEERLLPGLAMVAAATIGSAVLVSRARSLPVRILTPLATTAVAACYLLPDHVHFHNKSSHVPLTARAKEHVDAAAANTKAAVKAKTTTASSEFKPRSIVVDKSIASAAIKQHDAVINRGAMMGKNTEEKARKVHESIVDAALPVNRQGKNELHTIEVARKAYEQPTKLVVQELEHTPERDSERVKIKVNKTASKVMGGIVKGSHEIADQAGKFVEEGIPVGERNSSKRERGL